MIRRLLAVMLLMVLPATITAQSPQVKAPNTHKPQQEPQPILISPSERMAIIRRNEAQVEQMQKMENFIEDLIGRLNSCEQTKRS